MSPRPLRINGWAVYAHPLFLAQVEALTAKVKQLRAKDPESYRSKPATKRLAAIVKLTLNDISQDPSGSRYHQGNTLGTTHTHWHRAKFYQQYRLFFRYDLANKILIYAWINDESTKRAYGSKHDAYSIFRKMIENGNPPDSWDELWEAASQESERIKTLLGTEEG
ncbi:type II toxin-antitoxin system YhaV family toxin [Salinicola peritrichatus]|uniref:type II toxin-antitoxin system YhaV family toxin n=1 Tax=Salinicola peritrichatus TaxID=1267424 RepID=UPI000DA12569|nr:type II toxin-antitoxin system YhaV family toxin [Salinicola peritrichatus]